MKSTKILLITNIPTPYRIPFFNELDRQLKEMGIRLKVVFGSLGYSRRKWEIDLTECRFESIILSSRNYHLPDSEKVIFNYPDLLKVIKRESPDLVITNGFSISTLKLWWRSFFKRTPYVIWSGAIKRKERPDTPMRKVYRKLLIRRAMGFITYGSKAKQYLKSLGADERKITVAFNTVDTDFYIRETERIRGLIKRSPNGKKTLLYVGHLTKGKRLDQLLYAIKELSRTRQDFLLKIVGDGPERNNLELLASGLDIRNYISWEGFKQKNETTLFFAEADCFVFPSEYDVWGLVLVEAMASGLPCISSNQAGATIDLITDGETGFIVDFANVEDVTNKINMILDNQELALKLGRGASNFVQTSLSLGNCSMNFIKQIVSCI